MAQWSCNHAQLALFTHVNYRTALCSQARAEAHVTPAVWVNDADILKDASAETAWEAKSREPVRLLFAGRLVPSKGVLVLLAALRSLDERGLEARVDLIGQGEEREACLRTATSLRAVRLSVLESVPYGKPFFELLGRYHALLVPSLTEEQPRVVFDANAQAVPVIASETGGLRPYVDHGKTGWLVPVGDVAALAAAVERANGSTSELRSMGLAALRASRGLTHRAMHRWRSRLIRKYCT
jgi:glycosyltransferase involved in cell wall biosynthesis